MALYALSLYGSGPFKLVKEFKKFQKDSVVWHSLSEKDRGRYVEKFRAYKLILEDSFEKPKASGAKPNESVRKRKPEPSMIIDRINAEEWNEFEQELDDEQTPKQQRQKQQSRSKKIFIKSSYNNIMSS